MDVQRPCAGGSQRVPGNGLARLGHHYPNQEFRVELVRVRVDPHWQDEFRVSSSSSSHEFEFGGLTERELGFAFEFPAQIELELELELFFQITYLGVLCDTPPRDVFHDTTRSVLNHGVFHNALRSGALIGGREETPPFFLVRGFACLFRLWNAPWVSNLVTKGEIKKKIARSRSKAKTSLFVVDDHKTAASARHQLTEAQTRTSLFVVDDHKTAASARHQMTEAQTR